MPGLWRLAIVSEPSHGNDRIPLERSACWSYDAVGRHMFCTCSLSLLLGSRVAEYGRRVASKTELAPQVHANKLEQKAVNFEKIAEEVFREWQIRRCGCKAIRSLPDRGSTSYMSSFNRMICGMGTTRAAAGGMESFVKIDREYVLATAVCSTCSRGHTDTLCACGNFYST